MKMAVKQKLNSENSAYSYKYNIFKEERPEVIV